jgi:hypothetical protein
MSSVFADIFYRRFGLEECPDCKFDLLFLELYVLERCGHFFCVRCLYSYAHEQLRNYHKIQVKRKKSECVESEGESEKCGEVDAHVEIQNEGHSAKKKREYFQVLCPLPIAVCGIAISTGDMKVGFQTFSTSAFDEQQLV